MRGFVTGALLATSSRGTARGQAPTEPLDFPHDAFRANESIARWLVEYDRVARITTELVVALPDSAIEGLGPDWFCYQEDQRWYAVYGRYHPSTDAFRTIVHFEQREGDFARIDRPVATRYIPLVRALVQARAVFPSELREAQVRFRTFVRPVAEGIEVWSMPAQQSNGLILQGMAVRVAVSPDGRRIRDTAVDGSRMRPFRADTTLEVDLLELDQPVPTVQSLYFSLSHGRLFGRLRILTAYFATELAGDGRGDSWIHRARAP